MTRRRVLLASFAVLAVSACGRKGARSSDFDSATAAALAASGHSATGAANLPKIGHILDLELAHALDSARMVSGGAAQSFEPTDSIFVSVQTVYVVAGADVSVRIRSGKKMLDSVGVKSPAPDPAGNAAMGFHFSATTPWTPGSYSADVFLDGKFQLSRDFAVKP